MFVRGTSERVGVEFEDGYSKSHLAQAKEGIEEGGGPLNADNTKHSCCVGVLEYWRISVIMA